MRTVTKARGLLLSETVPDNFMIVCENTYPGSRNRTPVKRPDSKMFRMAVRFADVFGLIEV